MSSNTTSSEIDGIVGEREWVSRPESVDDLEHYELEGPLVAVFHPDCFADQGDMLTAHGAFVTAAKAAGYLVSRDGEVRRVLTDDDLQKKLAGAQRSWDASRDCYLRMVAGEKVADYMAPSIRRWCDREGVDYPTSPAATN